MHDIYSEIVEPRRKAGLRQVAEMLTSPTSAFRSIVESGHVWLYPFVVLSLVLVLSMLVQLPAVDDAAQESVLLGMDQEKLDAAITVMAYVFIFIFVPIFALAAIVLPALIFMFFENFVLGGRADYRQVLNVTAYAFMPSALGIILTSIISWAFQVPEFSFSPAVLLTEEMRHTFMGNWLGIFNVFTIWSLLLTTIGLSVLYGHSRVRTAAWLFPLYLVVFTFFGLFGSFMESFSSDMMAA
ncbi:MAG TPA: hypothetical protein ENO22_11075 [candidate division Zixibacteria bacterium]|nr:hypothetical protein [candidate division Zixibacteria bacterium]HEQ99868.1 hypothetical protein [candidate division Zixibacteria bacterium]